MRFFLFSSNFLLPPSDCVFTESSSWRNLVKNYLWKWLKPVVACLMWGNCYGLHVIEVSMFCNQETLEQEVKGLEERVSAIQQVLGDLKVQLYAKFGNNINLEADESWAVKWTLTAAPTWTFSCSSFIRSSEPNETSSRTRHERLRFVASFVYTDSSVKFRQTNSQGHQR